MQTFKIKRKIKSTLIRINELSEFKNKNIELEIKVSEIEPEKERPVKNFAGIFNKYADKTLIKNENIAWELAVREKSENYRR